MQDAEEGSVRWAEAFAQQAREHWTQARLDNALGSQRLIAMPHEAPVLLRAMGLLHRNATMPPAQVRKYRQINHLVALLGPPLRELAERFGQVHIVDMGCGCQDSW